MLTNLYRFNASANLILISNYDEISQTDSTLYQLIDLSGALDISQFKSLLGTQKVKCWGHVAYVFKVTAQIIRAQQELGSGTKEMMLRYIDKCASWISDTGGFVSMSY